MNGTCTWVTNSKLKEYHDEEWGVPVHDDQKLFEMLTLEGAQAGLNWEMILRKREAYRRAFDNFNPSLVAEYGADKIEELLLDPGIIRNQRKIKSTVSNAQAFLKVQESYGSFDTYIWSFVNGKPIVNKWKSGNQVPVNSEKSYHISKDLKQKGFKFVGKTICYSTMQAIGLINDHLVECSRYLAVLDPTKQVTSFDM